jgi:uncharacterized repeat protein (TIGR01451 family)
MANGDDLAGRTPDDEDGVTFAGPLVPGEITVITLTASVADGLLNAWIDFNGNGQFDIDERIAPNRPITAGTTITLPVSTPLTATGGITTYSRFRFSTQADLAPPGPARDGEVADYPVPVLQLDYGDLPDGPYKPQHGNNGPRHILDGVTWLGNAVDAEPDGFPSRGATGDDMNNQDDEDGVIFLTPIVSGQSAQIRVTAAATGYLNGWFDFDGDGQLDGPTDLFTVTEIDGTPVVSSLLDILLLPGVHTFTFSVPPVPISSSLYSRFRFTAGPGEATTPFGLAPTGEVEDYVLLSLGDLVWLDVNNNGRLDGGENGIPGVLLELRDAAGNPVLDGAGNPVTTTTGSDGRYLFRGLPSGDYTVFIPADQFAPGNPLDGLLSSDGAGVPDADVDETGDENGVDDPTPSVNGISSGVITLRPGLEPPAPDGDPNSNLTLDFGFYSGQLPALTKQVAFTPPPTATLGTVVTYTLTVPDPALSRTLVGVVVNDTLDGRLYPVTATVTGGISPVVTISGQQVRVGLARIVSNTQAVITVTAIISHGWPASGSDANRGETITNAATMTFTGSPALTTSNLVSTVIGEPRLALGKAAESSSGSLSGLDGEAWLTYTLRLTNTGDSPAYAITLSDTLPAGLVAAGVFGGDSNSGPAANPLLWQIARLDNGDSVAVSYTARLSGAATGQSLTNTATAAYHSLTDTVPGNRPYTTTTSQTVTTGQPATAKFVAPASSAANPLRIGDVVTYTLVNTVPSGLTLYWPYQVDALPAGMRYVPGSFQLGGTLPGALDGDTGHYLGLADYSPDYVTGSNPAGDNPNVGRYSPDTGREALEWWMETLVNSTDQPQTVVITLVAQFTGIDLDGAAVNFNPTTTLDRTNEQSLFWQVRQTNGFTSAGASRLTDSVTSTVGQPELSIDKNSQPAPGSVVGSGQTITYTLTVVNNGRTPAYDIVITDTLPVEVEYRQSEWVANPVSATITPERVGSSLRYTVSELAAGPASTMVITVVAQVISNVAANVRFTNTAAIPVYDSQPGPGPDMGLTPTQRVYTDGQDSVPHLTGQPELRLTKQVEPSIVAAGQLLTYTLTVENPGVVDATGVTISDTLPLNTSFVTASLPHTGPVNNTVIWPLGRLAVGGSAVVTLVVRLEAGVAAGTIVRNVALVTGSQGLTDTAEVTTPVETVADLVIAKFDEPDPVAAGAVLTYLLVYTNLGPSAAVDAVITDTLPAAVSFIGMAGASPAIAGPVQTGQQLSWQMPLLAAGATGQLTLTVRVADDVSGQIINRAVITSATPDPNDPNNRTDEPTTVLPRGIAVGKDVTGSPNVHAASVTYTLQVTNTGQITYTWLWVTDTLPVGISYQAGIDPASPTVIDGQQVAWLIPGPIGPGQLVQLTFLAAVDTRVPGQYLNVVTGTGFYTGGVVTDTADVPLQVSDPAIAVEKSVVAPGVVDGVITFTITVSNIGPSTMDVVPLFDYFSGDVVFNRASPEPNQTGPGVVVWNDLTAPPPYGFGRDFAPGAAFRGSTAFSVTAQAMQFSMVNTAVVSNAVDIFSNTITSTVVDRETITDVPTAINLLYFEGESLPGGVSLRWATAVEMDNFGFRILRGATPNLAEAVSLAFVPARGNQSASGAVYQYLDDSALTGTYTYWLVDIDIRGRETVHRAVTVEFSGKIDAGPPTPIYLPLIMRGVKANPEVDKN